MKYLEPERLWKEIMGAKEIPKKIHPLSYPGAYPTRIIYGWGGKLVYCGKPNARRVVLFNERTRTHPSEFFSFGEFDRNGLIAYVNFLGMWREMMPSVSHDLNRLYYYHPLTPAVLSATYGSPTWEVKRIMWPDKSRICPMYWTDVGKKISSAMVRAHKDWISKTYMGAVEL